MISKSTVQNSKGLQNAAGTPIQGALSSDNSSRAILISLSMLQGSIDRLMVKLGKATPHETRKVEGQIAELRRKLVELKFKLEQAKKTELNNLNKLNF